MSDAISLGARVVEVISWIEGIVVGRSERLYSVPKLCIARDGVKSCGSPWDEVWFEETRCTQVPA